MLSQALLHATSRQGSTGSGGAEAAVEIQSSGQAFSCSIVFCCCFSTPNNFSLKVYVLQGAANANRFLREGDLGTEGDPSTGGDGWMLAMGPVESSRDGEQWTRSRVHSRSPVRYKNMRGQKKDQRWATYSTGPRSTQEPRLETQTPPDQAGAGYPGAELK